MRVFYMQMEFIIGFGVYKMIFLLAPLLFLVFNIYSLEINFMELFMYWAPAF